MPYKFCPNCFSSSYSASEHKIWLCPGCGKDISFMPSSDQVYDLQDLKEPIAGKKPYPLRKTK